MTNWARLADDIESYLGALPAFEVEDDEDRRLKASKRQMADAQALRQNTRRDAASQLARGLSGASADNVIRVTNPLAVRQGAPYPLQVFNQVLAHTLEDEQLHRPRGGGGSVEISLSPMARHSGSSVQVAARAASAAGAQQAVFKVISTTSSAVRASALMQYIGTRDDAEGRKEDIAVFTEDGRVLGNLKERKEYLERFTQTFERDLQNTNFIELRIQIRADVRDEETLEALNRAFGSKPFVFKRDGQLVHVFAHTDDKASSLAKALQQGREHTKIRGLDKAERRIERAMADMLGESRVEIVAAVGNERKAAYFLQKFLRTHRSALNSSGDRVLGADRPQKAAQNLMEGWRPQIAGPERRNAYHLLFSAKEGTDPGAIMRAATATLDELASGHKFVLAYHADTKHVHVHAMVQALNADGDRLKFLKADLYRWRGLYAEKARENGVAMVATPRLERAAQRPFTKEHAGALKRSKMDERYRVSPALAARVNGKRAGEVERVSAVAHGNALAQMWTHTAVTMQAAGIAQPSVNAAHEVASNILAFGSDRGARRGTGGGPRGSGSDKNFDYPGMKDLLKLIGAGDMARTPLEMRKSMERVNEAFERINETLSADERKEFTSFRDEVDEHLHERLAELQSRKNTSGSEAMAGGEKPRDQARTSISPEYQSDDTHSAKAEDVKDRKEQKEKISREAKNKEADRQRQRNRDTERDR